MSHMYILKIPHNLKYTGFVSPIVLQVFLYYIFVYLCVIIIISKQSETYCVKNVRMRENADQNNS